MKKTLAIATIIFALLLGSLIEVQVVEWAKANFVPFGTVTITSPTNQTYHSNQLVLIFSVVFSIPKTRTVTYNIDNRTRATILGLEYNTTSPLWETANGTVPLPELAAGPHILEVYAATGYDQVLPGTGYATVYFSIADDAESTPSQSTTPSPSPTSTPTTIPLSEFSVSLSGSASALNFGNTINFTVSTNGGEPPYNFTWYGDGSALASTSSPYCSLDSMPIGSHHVYVQVTDANGNSATTLTVEFNVLPITSTSPSASPTRATSIPPTSTVHTDWWWQYSPTFIIVAAALAIILVPTAAILIYAKRKKKT